MPITPDQVPVSGDLAQLSQQLGVSQEEIIKLRRQRSEFAGKVTGQEGKTGDLETASFAERSALPVSGTGAKAYSYWDASRGVQVYAPYGSHFELYGGGGVKTISGLIENTTYDQPGLPGAPASSLFTQPTQGAPGGGTQAVPGFKQENLAYTPAAGKTIASTGLTVKNPVTGVDVYAQPGNTIIMYTDGTYEERPFGGTPGEAKPVSEAGPTAEELGITRKTEIKGGPGQEVTRAPMSAAEALAAAKTPEEKDKIIQQEGLTSTANLEFIGPEYTDQKTGQRRIAKPGNAFYQEPGTDTILERPLDLQSLAKPTTSPSVLAERQAQAQTPASDLLANYGLTTSDAELKSAFQTSPLGTFEDIYTSILEKLGVGSARGEIENLQKEIQNLDDKYADELADINKDPWIDEGTRVTKIRQLDDKYEGKRSRLVNQLQLFQNADDRARDDARFIATTTLNQYNAELARQQDQLQFAITRADKQMEAQRKAAEDAAKFAAEQQGKQADLALRSIREVQGGLYDISTGKFLIPPKAAAGKAAGTSGGSSGTVSSTAENWANLIRNDPSSYKISNVPANIRNQVVSLLNQQPAGITTSTGGSTGQFSDQVVPTSSPVSSYFAPTTNVRVRDVIRELPGALVGKGWLW